MAACNDAGFTTAKKNLVQPDLTPAEIARLVLLDTNYTYPLASAKIEAMSIAASLDAEDAKKGKQVSRAISGVMYASIPDTIRYPNTNREGKNDPGFYAFNFSEGNGFAIISSDKRAFGRLGWSGKGAIDNTETGQHMQLFASRAATYIQAKRKEVETMRGDSTYINLLLKLSRFKSNGGASDESIKSFSGGRVGSVPTPCQLQSAYQNKTGSTSRTEVVPCSSGCTLYQTSSLLYTSNATSVAVAPLLKTEWDQIAPYNNYYGSSACGYHYDDCNLSQNNNYFAGCTEIAEAQVVAYWWGKKYGGDWAVIANTDVACAYYLNPGQIDKVSTLVRGIYGSYAFTFKNCSTIGTTGTFTLPIPDQGISSSYGLTQGEWRSYNTSDLQTSLRMGSPVPVYGTIDLLCVCLIYIPFVGCVWNPCVPDPTAYHEWVIDGLETINTNSTYMIYPVDYTTCRNLPPYQVTYTTASTIYTHNNWGWGPTGGNGWYVDGAFGGLNSIGTTNISSYNHDDHIIVFAHSI